MVDMEMVTGKTIAINDHGGKCMDMHDSSSKDSQRLLLSYYLAAHCLRTARLYY